MYSVRNAFNDVIQTSARIIIDRSIKEVKDAIPLGLPDTDVRRQQNEKIVINEANKAQECQTKRSERSPTIRCSRRSSCKSILQIKRSRFHRRTSVSRRCRGAQARQDVEKMATLEQNMHLQSLHALSQLKERSKTWLTTSGRKLITKKSYLPKKVILFRNSI